MNKILRFYSKNLKNNAKNQMAVLGHHGPRERGFQVRVKVAERDALRFDWQSPEVMSLRLQVYKIKVWLDCSPFLLGSVLKERYS